MSVRPSTWQAWHEPHACPLRDQRVSPVLKKCLPRRIACVGASIGSGLDWATRASLASLPATICLAKSIADTFIVTSLLTNAKGCVFATAIPIGFWPFCGVILSGAGERSMKSGAIALPTDCSAPVFWLKTIRNTASAPLAAR